MDAEILKVLGEISVVIDEVVDSGPQDSRIMDQAPRALCLEVGAPARMHEQAILTMPGGQSGHPLSPFYGAGHDDWLKGSPTPLLAGAPQHQLRLVPSPQ